MNGGLMVSASFYRFKAWLCSLVSLDPLSSGGEFWIWSMRVGLYSFIRYAIIRV